MKIFYKILALLCLLVLLLFVYQNRAELYVRSAYNWYYFTLQLPVNMSALTPFDWTRVCFVSQTYDHAGLNVSLRKGLDLPGDVDFSDYPIYSVGYGFSQMIFSNAEQHIFVLDLGRGTFGLIELLPTNLKESPMGIGCSGDFEVKNGHADYWQGFYRFNPVWGRAESYQFYRYPPEK